MHLADDDKLDEAVYLWFVQKRTCPYWLAEWFFVKKLHMQLPVLLYKDVSELVFHRSCLNVWEIYQQLSTLLIGGNWLSTLFLHNPWNYVFVNWFDTTIYMFYICWWWNSYYASHIQQFPLSGNSLAPFMTDNCGSTVPYCNTADLHGNLPLINFRQAIQWCIKHMKIFDNELLLWLIFVSGLHWWKLNTPKF